MGKRLPERRRNQTKLYAFDQLSEHGPRYQSRADAKTILMTQVLLFRKLHDSGNADLVFQADAERLEFSSS